MKLKTWPDVWTFLRSIRQKRSLGNDRFALRSLGQASCPRWGLVASCMFLGVSIYTSLFWLEGDFRAPPFHCQLVQTKHVLGGKKSFDFHFFKRHEYSEIWTVELHHWFAPTRGVLKSFFSLTIHFRFVQTMFWRLFFASKGCFAWSKPQGPSNFNNQGWIAAVEGCWQELNLTPKGFSMHFKGQTHLNYQSKNYQSKM